MSGIDIMQDSSEIVPYNTSGLPMHISLGTLSHFPNHRMLCHWHDDLEWITVVDGSMRYQIGGQTVLLSAGDTLFVNTRQLHYGFSGNDPDCHYCCVLSHPDLLGKNKVLYEQFLRPVLENKNMPYFHLHAGTEDARAVYTLTDQILREKNEGKPGYEMMIIGMLHILWHQLYPLCLTTKPVVHDYSDETLQKDMVSFIQKHYAEHLTLADIAASGHVCQNKCCVIFRRFLQQSPIDFLNAYRLEVSCRLLRTTESSITDIALACGFNHLSYYSKLFMRKYGRTPTQWRAQHTKTPA